MKNFILIALLSLGINANAQMSCCTKTATASFASLSNDPAFVASHLSPLPLDYVPGIGKMVALKCPDGKEAKVFEVKSGPSQGKVILMFHEWWGLNDYIKREAERLHSETGFTVLALDLYDGKVATDPDEAGKLMQAMKDERVRIIIGSAIEYAGKFGKIQTIGWCMGGGWSMQAAIMAGPQCVGCVMYYGMPETDTTRISKMNPPVLAFFAKKDQWITPKVVNQFQADMKATGKSLTVYNYDAEHAFANPSNPKFNKEATADAHAKALAFIKANFPEFKPPASEEKK